MPRNAVTKHMLTIYMCTFALFPRVTRFRRQSVTSAPRVEIHWHKLKKEVHCLVQAAARGKSTRSKIMGPFLSQIGQLVTFSLVYNKPKLCSCGMHLETLPVPKQDFQLPTEVAVT